MPGHKTQGYGSQERESAHGGAWKQRHTGGLEAAAVVGPFTKVGLEVIYELGLHSDLAD